MVVRLSGYRFGRIEVDGVPHSEDLILGPRGVRPWWRREGHRVLPEDLEGILAERPEVVIVGTGHFGRVEIMPEAARLLADRGIELLALRTQEAVEAYNLSSANKRVCALFHLTC
jgi:hypothetical protein